MKFEVYQSKKNKKWYWRLKARNGRIIGDGGQGYSSQKVVCNQVDKIREGAAPADVIVLEDKPKPKKKVKAKK